MPFFRHFSCTPTNNFTESKFHLPCVTFPRPSRHTAFPLFFALGFRAPCTKTGTFFLHRPSHSKNALLTHCLLLQDFFLLIAPFDSSRASTHVTRGTSPWRPLSSLHERRRFLRDAADPKANLSQNDVGKSFPLNNVSDRASRQRSALGGNPKFLRLPLLKFKNHIR